MKIRADQLEKGTIFRHPAYARGQWLEVLLIGKSIYQHVDGFARTVTDAKVGATFRMQAEHEIEVISKRGTTLTEATP